MRKIGLFAILILLSGSMMAQDNPIPRRAPIDKKQRSAEEAIIQDTTQVTQTAVNAGQKIEQYECMFPQNFIFQSKDENGYNITKNFTVEAATLAYKSNKLVSFVLKSIGNAKVAYDVKQMISETSRVKCFWVDRSERYFVVVSFPIDIDNGMRISFISNIDGSVMFDFLFRKGLEVKEKKEQKRLNVKDGKERKIRYYRVKDGDRVQDIAEKLGVSVDTICKLNRVKKETKLRVGQALRIN